MGVRILLILFLWIVGFIGTIIMKKIQPTQWIGYAIYVLVVLIIISTVLIVH